MMRRLGRPLVVFACAVMLFGGLLSAPVAGAAPGEPEMVPGKTIHRFAEWKDDEAFDLWFWIGVAGAAVALAAVGGGAVILLSRKPKPGGKRRSGKERRSTDERRGGGDRRGVDT